MKQKLQCPNNEIYMKEKYTMKTGYACNGTCNNPSHFNCYENYAFSTFLSMHIFQEKQS